MTAAFYTDPAFADYRKHFGAGEYVFRQQGEDGDLGVLIDGKLEIIKDGYTVAVIDQPGAIIGEVSLVLGTPHTTGVKAISEAAVIIIPRDSLNTLGRKIPEFSLRIMRTLAERLEKTNARLAALEDTYDMLYNRMDSTVVASNKLPELEALHESSGEGRGEADWPDFKSPPSSRRSPLMRRDVVCVAHQSSFPPNAVYRKPQAGVPLGFEMFPIHVLRTGAVRFGEDELGLPVYRGAEPGFAPLDYALQEVHVCPVCLFASNDASNFLDARAKMDSGIFTIRRSIASKFAADMSARRERADSLRQPQKLFGPEREFKAAVVAYELAIMTAKTFHDYDPAIYSNWGFRIVLYNLKLAQLHKNYGNPENEKIFHACALEMIKESLRRFTGAHYFYAFFLLIALSDKLEGRVRAEEYFDKFTKLCERSAGRLDGRLGAIRDEYYGKAKIYLSGSS